MALKLVQKDKSFLTIYQLFVSANLISSHMLSSQDQKIVEKMMAVCVNMFGWEQYTISTSYIKICCFIVVSLLNFLLIGSSLHEMSGTCVETQQYSYNAFSPLPLSNIFSLYIYIFMEWQHYNFPGHDSSDGKVPTKLNTMSTLRKFVHYERALGELGIWYDEMQNISSKRPWIDFFKMPFFSKKERFHTN